MAVSLDNRRLKTTMSEILAGKLLVVVLAVKRATISSLFHPLGSLIFVCCRRCACKCEINTEKQKKKKNDWGQTIARTLPQHSVPAPRQALCRPGAPAKDLPD